MADKLSKFNIKGTLADVIDAEARASITTLSDNVTTAQNTADRAEGKADDALIGLESKQDISTAYKIGKISVTEENVTIASLATYTFRVPIPDGQTDIVVLNARSSDTTRTLIPVNLYTSGDNMVAIMSNQRTSAFTNETMTIDFIYSYK